MFPGPGPRPGRDEDDAAQQVPSRCAATAWAPSLDDPRVIADFVQALPRYEEALAGYSQDGNRALLAELDETLDKAAAGVIEESEED